MSEGKELNAPIQDWEQARDQALFARARGDHEAALELFRQAASLETEKPWLLLDVGAALRQLERLDEAAGVYLDAVTRDPALAQGFRGLGQIARQRGDHAEALGRFRAAVAIEPDNIWLWFDLASEARDQGLWDEAADAYRKMLAGDPKVFHGWRGLALVARQRGDHAEAFDCFRVAAIFNPSDVWVVLDAASEALELRRIDEAAAAYRQAAVLNPGLAPAWRGLALCARENGAGEAALENFRKAAACDANDHWSAYDAAMVLRDLGCFEEAAAACDDLLSRADDFCAGWRLRAQIARGREDQPGLLESLRAVARLEPQNPWAQFDLAEALRARGQTHAAEAAYLAAAEIDANLAHVRRGLGALARARGDHEAALAHFRVAARNEPANVWMHNEVATTLVDLGHTEEAERLLEGLVAERPDSADALLAYAHCIRDRASAVELIALYEKAARLAPGHAGAQLALAGALLRESRLDEAQTLFDARLAEQPDDVQALMGRAQVARRKGERSDALTLFEAAARAPGAHEWAVLEYAEELKEAGRRDDARRALEAEIARRDHPRLHLRLGLLAREAGDVQAARAAFAKALDIAPDFDEARIELAIEDFRQGDAERAIAAVKALLAARPDHARALTTLADFAEQIDDMDSAAELRRDAVARDPANLWTRLQLAETLAKLGRGDEADASLAECRTRFGDSPELRAAQAKHHAMLGDSDAAFALLRDGAAAFPNHFELWSRWVSALIGRGGFDEARRALETPRAAGLRERTQTLQLRGALAAAELNLPEAYRAFAEAAELAPQDGWIHEWAGRTALLRCDFPAAQRHLAIATGLNAAHRVWRRGGSKPSQSLHGQLLDEFRIDAEVADRLRDAMEAEDAIARVAGVAADAPDSTAAAMSLMIALRRRGRLTGAARGGPSPIPRAIAQFWDENIPQDVEKLCEGWRAAHPGFTYERFSSVDAARFLAAHGPAGAGAAFKRAREPAMKADLFRLAWLARHGGWYVDADDRCLKPLDGLDPGGCDLVLYQEENLGSTGNNFIGVKPGHPVIVAALAQAILAINRGDSDILWLSTGPGLLTRCVAAWLIEDLDARLERTRILTHGELSHAVAVWTAAAYKHTSKHWSRTVFGRARDILRARPGEASTTAA